MLQLWAERRVSCPHSRRHGPAKYQAPSRLCSALTVDLVLPLLDGEHSPKGMDQDGGGRVRTDRAASG